MQNSAIGLSNHKQSITQHCVLLLLLLSIDEALFFKIAIIVPVWCCYLIQFKRVWVVVVFLNSNSNPNPNSNPRQQHQTKPNQTKLTDLFKTNSISRLLTVQWSSNINELKCNVNVSLALVINELPIDKHQPTSLSIMMIVHTTPFVVVVVEVGTQLASCWFAYTSCEYANQLLFHFIWMYPANQRRQTITN